MVTQQHLPYDESAERAVLGSILLDSTRCLDVCRQRKLTAEGFHVPAHRSVFLAMLALDDARRAVDVLTVSSRLREAGELAAIGDVAFLNSCIDATPTAAHLEHYLQIVLEKWARRELIAFGRRLEQSAYDPDIDPEEARSRAELECSRLGVAKQEDHATATEILDAEVETWVRAREQGCAGVTTGFTFLDRSFGGLMDAALYFISGPPGACKTTLVRNIAEHVAGELGFPVAFSSLEQRTGHILRAMSARRAKESVFLLNSGSSRANIDAIREANTVVSQWPLMIQDRPQTLSQFCSWARSSVRQGAKVIIVDYVQRLIEDRRYQSDENRYRDYSLTIVNLCKELRVPLLAISRESDEGKLYGARQWSYDAWCWLRLEEAHHSSASRRVFDVSINKIRFGPRVESVCLELSEDGASLRPYIPSS